jgi:hypothetical protein
MSDCETKPAPRVVHCKREPGDVYCGRPSKWGNPCVGGAGYTRHGAVCAYRDWIEDQPDLLAQLHELRGKTLGCWCAPRECHCDVLLELANGA